MITAAAFVYSHERMRTRLQLRKTYCYDFVNNLIARDHSHEGKACLKRRDSMLEQHD